MPYQGGFIGLAAVEMPEARFREEVTLPDLLGGCIHIIDARFMSAIEPETLRIVSVIGKAQVSLLGDQLIVMTCHRHTVHITLSAIRAGCRMPRFPEFTLEQMRRNQKFYTQAHAA